MRKNNYLLPFIATLIVLLFSVDKSSIWIDEMLTYQVVHENGFSGMFSKIWNAHDANGGMPLYFILEWMWTRFWGYDEIGLRSMNILFALIYFITSWHIIRKSGVPSWFCLLFFLNPLFIYYMNEARPYVLLLSIGSMYACLLFYRNLNDYKTLFGLYLTFLIGWLVHMMFAFIVLMYVVQCIRLIRLRKLDISKHLAVLAVFAIPYGSIFYYYMGLMAGAGEIGGPGMLAPDWKASILQILYYFTGFGGLGLSRNDLRSMEFSHLSWIHIAFIAGMLFSYTILLFYVIKNKLGKDRHLLTVFLSGFVAFGMFCMMNILFQTRFWERHVIYLLPALLILLCNSLKRMIASPPIIYQISALSIVCLTVVSGLRTMFDKYYGKEDYKGVSAYIQETKGALFLLQGDPLIYKYYGIDPGNSEIQMINNINREDLNRISSEKKSPIYLVLSVREEFDSGKLYHILSQTSKTDYNSFRIVRYVRIE